MSDSHLETKNSSKLQLDLQLAKLYERALSGSDTQAIEEIVSLCEPEVSAIALSVVHDRESAKDVVQMAFIKFSQRYRRISKNSIRAWLRRTAFHDACKEAKKRRPGHLPIELVQGILHDLQKNPLETLINRERIELMIAAMRQLTARQQECLALYLRGLEGKEAAALFKTTVSTYYATFSHALARLRKMMKGD